MYLVPLSILMLVVAVAKIPRQAFKERVRGAVLLIAVASVGALLMQYTDNVASFYAGGITTVVATFYVGYQLYVKPLSFRFRGTRAHQPVA